MGLLLQVLLQEFRAMQMVGVFMDGSFDGIVSYFPFGVEDNPLRFRIIDGKEQLIVVLFFR